RAWSSSLETAHDPGGLARPQRGGRHCALCRQLMASLGYPPSLGVSFILLVSPTMRLPMLLRRRVLLIVLLHHRFMGLVLVVLTVEDRLLLRRGIPLARVLPLIGRHGRRAGGGGPRRLLPAMMGLLPAATPVLAPSRRRTCRPSPEVGRRTTVVPDGNAQ